MKPLNPAIQDWAGKTVWLIGASTGIGAALAQRLSSAGARLVLSSRTESALEKLAGDDDMVLPLDVGSTEQVGSAYKKLVDTWQAPDLVVYCAGAYKPMRAWQLEMEKVRQTFRSNLDGVYLVLDAILPDLIKRGSGGICLVGSVAGYTGLPNALAYGPSKAALINLAQILYSDLAPRGIGIYLVNPGFVATRLTEQNDFRMPALISTQEAADEIIKGLQRGRFETHFPARFTWWMKLLSRLPDRLRFSLLKRAMSE